MLTTPPAVSIQISKVVVAMLDERRVKGYVYNFSPIRDVFSVFPSENSPKKDAVEIKLIGVKAIFFVKTFTGNPAYRDTRALDAARRGRKIEVAFFDGEKLTGTTEAYHPQKPGFFLFVADPKSNNVRVYVVNANVRSVRFL